MNAHTKLSPAYLARAEQDARDEAADWHKTPAASLLIGHLFDVQRLRDRTRAIAYDLEGVAADIAKCERDKLEETSEDFDCLVASITDRLDEIRSEAIDCAAAGFDDEDFEDDLERDTTTVAQAIGLARRAQLIGLWSDCATVGDPFKAQDHPAVGQGE